MDAAGADDMMTTPTQNRDMRKAVLGDKSTCLLALRHQMVDLVVGTKVSAEGVKVGSPKHS
jgi:hypothetical protein